MNKIVKLLKNKYIISLASLIIVILFVYNIFSNKSNTQAEIVKVESGKLLETVDVTGKVRTYNKAELSIERAGTVKSINFKVGDKVNAGDIIVSLESSDILAQIQGAEANLMAEEARLSELKKGLRPEELIVEDSKLNSAKTDFDDARIGIINALHDSYSKSSSAILNYSDILFTNPQNAAPTLNIRSNYEESIIKNRVLIGDYLRKWKEELDTITLSSDPTKSLANIHKYLEVMKVFMGHISISVANIKNGNSGLSQAILDSYILNVTEALTTFNSGVSVLASAESTYNNASSNLSLIKNQYDLKKAGSSFEALQIQEAKVAQAQASIAGYRAELLKNRIISPIDGIIGKIDAEIGEYISIGKVASVVVSDEFKIEVNVPESDISKISLNNNANITLDAYDETVIFNAHVISIDLAETIIEGVPTYKVVLKFDENDSRIRSGMTANINIITQNKEKVLLIPFRAIIDKNGEKFVKVSGQNGYYDIKIKIGARGNDGKVEVIEGITEGVSLIILEK